MYAKILLYTNCRDAVPSQGARVWSIAIAA